MTASKLSALAARLEKLAIDVEYLEDADLAEQAAAALREAEAMLLDTVEPLAHAGYSGLIKRIAALLREGGK